MKSLPSLVLLLWLVIAPRSMAQGDPSLGYIYPAGGRQGTTFQATIGGRYLNATTVFCSGTGVSATVINQERQVSPTEQSDLRETLNKIQEKRKQGQPVTEEEAKTAENIKQKLVNFGRRLTNPSLGEFITLSIAIAPTAAPGNREIRVMTPSGLSNPLVFQIGDLPETSKPAWKDIPKAKNSMEPELDPKPPVKKITLPITLNGQIPPGGADRYQFHAEAGQQWTVVVRARELIPYISDAVPGWFQAVATLTDANGREIACSGDFGFHPDPVLHYQAPASGDYTLEIKDSLYRGRENFVYRITVGALPFVTGVFPLGGKTGTQANISATGWNLPFEKLPLDLRNQPPGIRPLPLEKPGNSVPVAADILPETLENEPNNTKDTAQTVTTPVIINGRIEQPGEMDVFRIEGKQGDSIVAEVQARRLDSPLDSMLALTDAAGRQLAFNDDHEDKGSGLNTHHADSYLAFTLPATGSYYIHLGDTQQGGGTAYAYRLRISAPRPDFELRVTPSSLNVRGGASVPVTVHALRKDGFTGAIALRLKDAPAGFSLTGARIPEHQDKIRFTLNASPPAAMEPFTLHLEGSAILQGNEVVRTAVPADDMMQAFAYRHLVPSQELKVAVIGRFRPGTAAQVLSPTPVRLPANGSATIHVKLPAGPLVKQIDFELSEAPDGISLKVVSPTELLLQTTSTKIKPGTTGNLIIKGFAAAPAAEGGQAPAENRRRIPLGALPAIPYEIGGPSQPQSGPEKAK